MHYKRGGVESRERALQKSKLAEEQGKVMGRGGKSLQVEVEVQKKERKFQGETSRWSGRSALSADSAVEKRRGLGYGESLKRKVRRKLGRLELEFESTAEKGKINSLIWPK